MTSGEDLLLLAIAPRSGRVRQADRVKFALRASVLFDLVLAQRITVNANRITVLDRAATGNGRLDNALVSLGSSAAPSLSTWLRDTPSGYGIVNQYLSILADQGTVRLKRRLDRIPAPMDAGALDRTRRDVATARVDRVARGRPSENADRTLAAMVRMSGLDRSLYRFSPRARRRMARLSRRSGPIDSAVAELTASADAELADSAVQAMADGASRLTDEMWKLMHTAYQIEHITSSDHHGDTHTHHHGGLGGSGGGHHSHH